MRAGISKDDFRRIRLSLAAAMLMFCLGAAAIYGTSQLLKAERKNHEAAKAKRTEIQGQLSRARDEELEIKQKIARFNELSRQGVIGLERRLDWIEQIRQIKGSRKLMDIQYEIAPQVSLDSAILSGGSGEFEFLSSQMQFKMDLLHEDDLLNFLADLHSTAKAYLRVRRCDIGRLTVSSRDGRGPPPQLSAACTVDWITVRERRNA